MPFKTAEQYLEDMRNLKRTIYVYGEKVENYVDHPAIRPPINCVAKTYEAALVPEFKSVMVAKSHLDGKETSIFNITYQSKDNLIQRCQVQRLIPRLTGYCSYRCLGSTLLSALYDLTYEIDNRHNTEYHQRFVKYLKYIQDNDLSISESMTDVKGDRSKHPSEQADPDLHVRIVEKKKDGVVIRGAKAHQSGAVASHEHIVVPTRTLLENEKDWAIVCAVPADVPGVIQIFQGGPEEAKIMMGDGGNEHYGTCSTSLLIFDDVFVPWERVFMCGEYELTGTYIFERYSPIHRIAGSTCKGGLFDILTGTAQSLMEYNGLKRGISHLRDKLVELMSIGEICYGTGIASAVMAYKAPSGIMIPDPAMGNASKIFAANNIYEAARLTTDIAGGLIATIPSWKDYQNPETKKYLEKYLKGVPEIPVEHRIRLFKFLQTTIAESSMCPNVVLGAGTSEIGKIGYYHNVDMESKKKFAQTVTGIIGEGELAKKEYVKDLAY
ncbi:4-hydroxyphenylacetate 3-hydroxylase N-terminal domain-containing protein [Chloroflexota bacterium]